LLKILGITLILTILFSINYLSLTVSQTILEAPIQVIVISFIDTIIFAYFVSESQWTGFREWAALFLVFYGVNYVLTAMESFYLVNLLPMRVVLSIIVNGAVVSSIFATVIVLFLGKKSTVTLKTPRLEMKVSEWAWKLISTGVVYVFLFIFFGIAVYYPLANAFDSSGLIIEQSSFGQAVAWILPFEAFRGIIWTILGVPAILSLQSGRRKTAIIMALLFAVPISLNMLLPTSSIGSLGLQMAHFAEVLGENLVFGAAIVWILQLHSRLQFITLEKASNR
jgi:hypothetical protein